MAKKAKYSEEEILRILQQKEMGVPLDFLCYSANINDATFYNWNKKYKSMLDKMPKFEIATQFISTLENRLDKYIGRLEQYENQE